MVTIKQKWRPRAVAKHDSLTSLVKPALDRHYKREINYQNNTVMFSIPIITCISRIS